MDKENHNLKNRARLAQKYQHSSTTSERELSGLSRQEKQLAELIFDAYRERCITGIEAYSGGCMQSPEKTKAVTEKYASKQKLKKGEEQFVFQIYMPSDKFLERHKIEFNQDSNNNAQNIARHITAIASEIPGSNSFHTPEALGQHGSPLSGGHFGFTLNGRAARAIHKINIQMNPTSRGAGD